MSYLFLKSRVYSVQPKYTHLSPVMKTLDMGNINYGVKSKWHMLLMMLLIMVLVLEELQWSTMSPNLL